MRGSPADASMFQQPNETRLHEPNTDIHFVSPRGPPDDGRLPLDCQGACVTVSIRESLHDEIPFLE